MSKKDRDLQTKALLAKMAEWGRRLEKDGVLRFTEVIATGRQAQRLLAQGKEVK